MARHLVTSALPYINGVKHLGNLAGSMLPADVYARFLRHRGNEVLFICATDEHGTPAELAALEAGLDVAKYCTQQHEIQARLSDAFDLSFDYFGRSSSSSNHELTRHFASKLEENGFVEERLITQIYSLDDRRFLPDRYVVGTCPHCGYEAARGDQCENCTRVLDPTDLIHPRSAVSGSTNLELRETRHLYFLQSRLAGDLERWIRSHDDWPLLVTSIGLKWLREGLQDRGITRDLSWGIPVDRPGFEGKVYYVWFDAPIAYIAATKDWAENQGHPDAWRAWWWEATDVTYTQFMAKDNVPFHTVGFPATLLASREPWKLVDYLKGFNWMTYYGGKFSTSRGVGIFMSDALELLPADYWRWFLVAHAPENADSSFTWELFQETVNKDLADVYGNFVIRVLRLIETRFDGSVPEGGSEGPAEATLTAKLDEATEALTQSLERVQFRQAAKHIRAMWSLGNAYLHERAPWTMLKTDPAAAAVTLRTAVNLIRYFSLIAAPIIPASAQRVLQLVDEDDRLSWPGKTRTELKVIPAGRGVGPVPDVIFRKITDQEVTEWVTRFGGGEESEAA
jgi:methionyl-tRNA synthetase